MQITLNGQKVKWEYVDRVTIGAWHTSRGKGPMGCTVPGHVQIRNDPDGRELMDTEIHEALHLILPDLNEEAVHRSAGELSKLLHRLGYRLTPPT